MTRSLPESYVYLRRCMQAYDGQNPPSQTAVADMRQQFQHRLDKDMEAATDAQMRQTLKALGAAASHAFDRIAGGGSSTNLETFNDLANLAAGVRGPSNLAPVGKRQQQRTGQEDWDLACAVVALRLRPNDAKVASRIKKRTGKTVDQIKKLKDNMKQEKGIYEAVKRNIEDIERLLGRGETWPLDDFVK